MVQQQLLDAAGKATFTLTDLPVGTYTYKVAYEGDQYFNGATVSVGSIYVQGISTSTMLLFDASPCGDSEITAVVTNPNGSTPTGSVRFLVSGSQIALLPLVPTATPGEARASVTATVTFAGYSTSV